MNEKISGDVQIISSEIEGRRMIGNPNTPLSLPVLATGISVNALDSVIQLDFGYSDPTLPGNDPSTRVVARVVLPTTVASLLAVHIQRALAEQGHSYHVLSNTEERVEE